MVADVVWLEQARSDLLDILDTIAVHNSSAAEAYVGGLEAACLRLEEFPLSGRRYNDEFRVLVFRNHLVFHTYDQASALVTVAMVLDARRDIGAIFRDHE